MNKKLLAIALITLCFCGAKAQKLPTYSQWSAEEIKQANTAVNAILSPQEKNVYTLCNLARLNGRKFAETYVDDYCKKHDIDNVHVNSLKADLINVIDLPMLRPVAELCEVATFHALDMGNNGLTGHTSSDGTDWSTRLRRQLGASTNCSESDSYGLSSALDIVMSLLIDEKIPSHANRRSIINSRYINMGVSIQPHKRFKYTCVIDYAGRVAQKNVPHYAEWSAEEYKRANTAANQKMLQQEKDIYLLFNLARIDGDKFARTYVASYFKYIQSDEKKQLISALQATYNLPVIEPSAELCQAAIDHATEMGRAGKMGHKSLNDDGPGNRISRYKKGATNISEICNYGNPCAMDIVMSILICEGEEDSSQRDNILSRSNSLMGVSIKPHKNKDYNCVIDFATFNK